MFSTRAIALHYLHLLLSGIHKFHLVAGFAEPQIDQIPRLRLLARAGKTQDLTSQSPCHYSTNSEEYGLMTIHPSTTLCYGLQPQLPFFRFCRSGEVTVESEFSYDSSHPPITF